MSVISGNMQRHQNCQRAPAAPRKLSRGPETSAILRLEYAGELTIVFGTTSRPVLSSARPGAYTLLCFRSRVDPAINA
jgi:hypothetical protein